MRRPNFLVIVTDQHRADHLGCYGHPVLRTPHIDALAARGTRFERFHAASPVCMPNRASLLTGRYPSAHGLRVNGAALSVRATTFVEQLRRAGYRTASIGKSHVQPMTDRPAEGGAAAPAVDAWKDDGGDYTQEQPGHYAGLERHPLRTPYYGYDEVDLVTFHGDQAGGHYLQWLRRHLPEADRLRDRSSQLPHGYVCPQAHRTAIPEAFYPTSYIRDRAVDFLRGTRGQEQPFFAFVSFPDPHHPFTPPGRYWGLYDPADFGLRLPYEAHHNPPPPIAWCRERFLDGSRQRQGPHDAFFATEREIREAMALSAGMIAMIDDAVGDIVRALDDSGQREDTVIVFTSDHGDYLGDFNLMLKGALASRGITRVPFIWCDPRQGEPAVSQALASTIDIAPSVLARAAVEAYGGLQGRSLLDCLDGRGRGWDALLIEYQDSRTRQGFQRPACVRSLLTERHRLSVYQGESWGELYDHHQDPGETHNLWEAPGHRDTQSQLMQQLLRKMLAAVDTSPPARYAA
ncbi:sulfatase-like hydrolase/transferase [Hydrogenophaga sp. SNF1]|uniref:sulfatase family protein n=1 Tax=Hydrogenophaga sp. SNF1 TaxID=3098762 RepID=UPI002ACC2B33|nr:sulfatase-like hydrolase/transferase [Hydrogenophaga sp. SNF1]WQB83526.1 sulfatase-like hydrolase/transferase [Hydrogenophaga sp. SNF1]